MPIRTLITCALTASAAPFTFVALGHALKGANKGLSPASSK